jgi:hypothetical protein
MEISDQFPGNPVPLTKDKYFQTNSALSRFVTVWSILGKVLCRNKKKNNDILEELAISETLQ